MPWLTKRIKYLILGNAVFEALKTWDIAGKPQ